MISGIRLNLARQWNIILYSRWVDMNGKRVHFTKLEPMFAQLEYKMMKSLTHKQC